MMNQIAIYRHELFKFSEGFIADQAEMLHNFRPLYVGRRCFGNAPANADHFALWDEGGGMSAIRRAHQVVTRGHGGFFRYLKERPVRLIHAHFGVEGVYALPVAQALKVPLVTTFHGFDATTSATSLLKSCKPAWINYLRYRKKLSREGQMFLCVSNYIRERVLALGFPENKTRLHYIGVNTDLLKPPSSRPEQPTVLHVGRLVEKKGCGDLITAFAGLPKRHKDAHLLIVGEGPLLRTLKEKARILGVGNRVFFVGAKSQEDVYRLMGDATVLCQPSVTAASGDTEGLPVVLLEAAARGLSIVSTQHAGIPELIEDSRTGLLVNEHDVSALTDALGQLLDNASLRERLAVASRKRVVSDFDLRTQSIRLSGIYEGLL